MKNRQQLKLEEELRHNGFIIEKIFTAEQLETLTEIVENTWKEQLRKIKGGRFPTSAQLKGAQKKHHEFVNDQEHKKNWGKRERMLTEFEVNKLEKEGMFNKLREIFGHFDITDEEGIGYPNIYWRLVRPNKSCDVGPIHRDEWFWLLDDKQGEVKGMNRLKIWIPLIVERGNNGLMIESGSHLREDIKWHGELRDGKMKPHIDMSEDGLNMKLADVSLKEAIIFDDKLLHGGKVNTGNNTRVSIEFTISLCEANKSKIGSERK